MKKSLIVLIALTLILPSFIFLNNLKYNAFNQDFYHKEFEKYGIYDTFKNKAVIDEVSLNLVNYLKGKENLKEGFFNEKEKQHLSDVKHLLQIVFIKYYISFVIIFLLLLLLIFSKNYKYFSLSLIFGSGLTIFVVLLFLFISLINFDFFFTLFHKLLFTNNLWLLNPATDKLVVMFPEEFFIDLFRRLIIFSLIDAVVIGGLATLFYFYIKKF